MSVRKRGNKLETWEIALVKAMLAQANPPNAQDILAYFSRPTRSLNFRAISEIRNGAKHASIESASQETLNSFLTIWPDMDPESGLSTRGDELLIKAREALIAAVHIFNSAGLTFRAELFIVTAVIGWTYLLHSWFKREGIDFRYTKNVDGKMTVQKTSEGADKYWDLSRCLNHAKCPVEAGAKVNLDFLLELRHEIEHRSTSRIDDAVSGQLQSCCLNFNDVIKSEFGPQFALERRLPIALQFVTFGPDQLDILKKAKNLPRNVETMMDSFEGGLTDEQRADPRYAFHVFMRHNIANREPNSNMTLQLVPPGSDEAATAKPIGYKEVEKKKYLPSDIVARMKGEGWDRFTMDSHTKLWQGLGARGKGRDFGALAFGKQWCWYESWMVRVREECQQHPDKYKSVIVPT